jgi:adenylate cyclase, class 2
MNKQANTEFETKVLDFDLQKVISKLRELGAKETPEFLAKRYVFDIDSPDIEWIRLRDSNGKITLTYKYKVRGNTEIGNTIEIEVGVSDFEKTAEILNKLEWREVYYQENRNHIFELDGIEFSIDSWPKLSPYLEIEADSKERVQEGLKMIGLLGKDVGDKDIVELYREKLGVSLHSEKVLKFEG